MRRKYVQGIVKTGVVLKQLLYARKPVHRTASIFHSIFAPTYILALALKNEFNLCIPCCVKVSEGGCTSSHEPCISVIF